ncbi:MAG TPA: hypothetical protein VGU24_21985 [Microvirga sp.]|jgi:hypothetical protein|nr:hypothetical protein [Microvirga sp.]
MSFTFTPRSLLHVGSLLQRSDNQHVRPGWHIVLRTHERLGLPLHPFVAIPLSDRLEPGGGLFTESGQPAAIPIDPRVTRVVRIADATTPHDPRVVAARITVSPRSRIQVSVTEPGRADRVIARRVLPTVEGDLSWRFPVPGRVQLVFRGEGKVTELQIYRLHENLAEFFAPDHESITFGLPVSGDHLWYSGGEGADRAMMRVEQGAPEALSPVDRPDGAYVRIGSDADVSRVKAQADVVLEAVEIAIGHPAPDPHNRVWALTGSSISANDDMRMELSAHAALQTFAGDPSLARFLGFSLPVLQGFDQDSVWLIAALFGVEMRDRFGTGVLRDHLMPQTQVQSDLRHMLLQRYPSARQVGERQEGVGRTVVPIVGVAIPTELDRHEPPELRPWSSVWHLATDRRTSMGARSRVGWRQTIDVLASYRLGMLAISRDVGMGTEPLNRPIPGLAAHRVPIFAAGKPKGTTQAPQPGAAIVDMGLAESAARARWTVFAADEFGRWSDPATLSADAPPRPRPPVPQPRVSLVRNPAVADAGAGLLSPGAIRFELDLPGRDRLAPGARSITEVSVEVVGVGARSDPPSSPHVVEIAAPALAIGVKAEVTWTVRFSDGTLASTADEATARGTIRVTDARRPEPQRTSRTLVWTARRNATAQAEVELRWPADAPDYHVWLSDEATLLALLPPGGINPSMSRAERATRIYDELQNRASWNPAPDDAAWFTRLTDLPIASSDGTIEFRFQLPGSAEIVYFLRFVPVTANGVEAVFSRCGVVPVAVPIAAVPPPPTVVARPEGGGIRVDVSVGGLDRALMGRLQQGGDAAPECRVKRVFSRATDPLYFEEIERTFMVEDPPGSGRWAASFLDDGSRSRAPPPFVPVSYVAEVRYPPELAVIRGAVLEPLPRGVGPIAGVLGEEIESAWGSASIPVASMIVPEPPAAPQGVTATAVDDVITVEAPSLPVSHARAIGSYQLALWSEAVDGRVAEPRLAPVGTSPVAIDLPGAAETAAVRVAVLDPLGRLGEMVRVPKA